MKHSVIAGVDVSKLTLDIFFKPLNAGIRIANTATGFKQLLKELQQQNIPLDSLLIIMEHTGKYSYRWEVFLRSIGVDYCKISALQIKRSLGVIRGKNDKVDAERIADYGWLRRDKLTADMHRDEQINILQELLSLRLKMVRDRSGYMCRVKEMKATGGYADLIKIQQQLIVVFSTKIKALEEKIRLLICQHPPLQQACQLLRTIKGVGWIVAAYMISCTDNFKRFKNARKFNCYAGLAPFNHESGSSIKGKARVSHLANKEIKALLNLSASSAIQHDAEMKQYYQKRVAEGKRKMSCLNIIRSKLVARMFAVIKRQTPYLPLLVAV